MRILRDARQYGGLFLILAMMATALGVIAATEVASAHGANQNGCTAVPDSGPGFDFHNACDSHDLCYTFKPYGDTSAGRKACDDRFLNDMRSSCNRMWSRWYQGPIRAYCKSLAYTYYTGVRAAGGFYW